MKDLAENGSYEVDADMKEKIKNYRFPVAGFAVSLLAALFWVALRINHSGISKFLGADTNPSF